MVHSLLNGDWPMVLCLPMLNAFLRAQPSNLLVALSLYPPVSYLLGSMLPLPSGHALAPTQAPCLALPIWRLLPGFLM